MIGSARPQASGGDGYEGTPGNSWPRRLIFWDFSRGSWQYDVVVGLILLFIFATPRSWFHDQPKPSSLVFLSSAHGAEQIFIAADLLPSVATAELSPRAEKLIYARTGKRRHITRVEPIRDSEDHEIKGFVAYTNP